MVESSSYPVVTIATIQSHLRLDLKNPGYLGKIISREHMLAGFIFYALILSVQLYVQCMSYHTVPYLSLPQTSKISQNEVSCLAA